MRKQTYIWRMLVVLLTVFLYAAVNVQFRLAEDYPDKW